MHARVIITESGNTVSVPYLVLAKSKQHAVQKANRRMRSIIESVVIEAEQPLELDQQDIAMALDQGYWWAELDGSIFTVMIQNPQTIDSITGG